MIKRVAAVQLSLRQLDVPAILITNLTDVKYISGFTGSTAYIIIDIEKAVFFTDSRYTIQARNEVDNTIEIIEVKDYTDIFNQYCTKYKKILLQSSCPLHISSKISAHGIDIYMDDKDFIKQHRMIKSDKEIKLIEQQYNLAGKAFLKALKTFKYGMSEKSWAASIEYYMKMLGAKGESFETIVASKERGAMPHGTASNKIIEISDPVIIDFGSRDLYTSDYTRMVYDGSDEEVLKIIAIVRTALEKSIDAVKTGMLAKEIDKTARDYIESQGYGKYFNHSLGHGVGMDVHELPVLSTKGEIILEDNMVFTIEPGIYLPDKLGVRLEETVKISGGKAELISTELDKYVYHLENN